MAEYYSRSFMISCTPVDMTITATCGDNYIDITFPMATAKTLSKHIIEKVKQYEDEIGAEFLCLDELSERISKYWARIEEDND